MGSSSGFISLNVAKFSSSAVLDIQQPKSVLYKENKADVLFYVFSIQRGRAGWLH